MDSNFCYFPQKQQSVILSRLISSSPRGFFVIINTPMISIFSTKYKILAVFVAVTLVAGGLIVAAFNPAKVIDTNKYAVLYSDNIAEIIFRDTFDNQSIEIYRSEIELVYLDEEKSRQGFGPVRYVLPEVTLVGDNNDRAVFTIRNGERLGYLCDSDIFYVDRITRTSKVIDTSLCIVKTLDENIYTRFWASEYFGYTETRSPYFDIGVGDYATGEIVASSSVEVPVWTDGVSSIGWYSINPSGVVSDPEITKVVFAFVAGPECGDYVGEGCDTPAFIYLFDLETGEVRDVTPEKGVTFNTLYPSDNHLDHSMLRYEVSDDGPEEGRFIIAGIDGPGYNEPYAIIDVR